MIWVVLWILGIIVATIIGSGKNKTGTGFALGFFLSWIGVIIIAVMDEGKKKCSLCNSEIEDDWETCPHCQNSLKTEIAAISKDLKCSNCGEPLNTSWQVCPKCSTKVPEGVKVTRSYQEQKSIDAIEEKKSKSNYNCAKCQKPVLKEDSYYCWRCNALYDYSCISAGIKCPDCKTSLDKNPSEKQFAKLGHK